MWQRVLFCRLYDLKKHVELGSLVQQSGRCDTAA